MLYIGRAEKTDEEMDMSLVSIIVPVYNVEPYIETCIQSLIRQTMGNIEVILVDDGSRPKR